MNAILAVNLGASAPLIVSALAGTIPVAATRSTLRGQPFAWTLGLVFLAGR
ncbi:MAG TPA: hypothetical protein VHR45_14835 [Thermoanaerobaculia bacterium]|nr:hypothetical protein [Thermoanaerobaculia bacterium]